MGYGGVGARSKPDAAQLRRFARRVQPWGNPRLNRAQKVILFCESLPITSGTLAGRQLELRPWQRSFVKAVYRTDRRKGRNVRTAVLSMARKNGKTQLAAALALCHLCGPEAESRGEVYSAANERAQAGRIFKEMVAIIERTKWMRDRINIIRFRMQLEDLVNGSVYAALSADVATKHGL